MNGRASRRPRAVAALAACALAACALAAGACAAPARTAASPAPSLDAVRAALGAELRAMVAAAERGDAEAFVRADSVVTITAADGRAERRTRAELVSEQQQRWSVVVETKALALTIDSVQLHGDSAVAFTRQRWERVLRRPDGATYTRLTHAAQRETWMSRPTGWRTVAVRLLGDGPNYTDGRPDTP